MSKPRIAFLGLGLMGSGMAHRLLAAGFPLAVYNRSPEPAAPFAAGGAHAAATPREAAAEAEVGAWEATICALAPTVTTANAAKTTKPAI